MDTICYGWEKYFFALLSGKRTTLNRLNKKVLSLSSVFHKTEKSKASFEYKHTTPRIVFKSPKRVKINNASSQWFHHIIININVYTSRSVTTFQLLLDHCIWDT